MKRPGDTIEPMTFDTQDLPEARRFPAFAAAIENFTVTPRQAGPFHLRARIWRIGSLILTHVKADPLHYERSIARVRSDAVDHIVGTYLLKGGYRVDCGDGMIRAVPNSFSIADLRQPFQSEDDRLELVSISMPRGAILPKLGDVDPHGLMARGGLVPMLGGVIRGLLSTLPTTPLSQAQLVERMLIDLVVETVLEALRSGADLHARTDALISRARCHIDQNLTHALDVETICTALGVSRSGLYRAFRDNGGIQRQILLRRLRCARSLLADPRETRSITAIAEAVGFADKSHFNKAFKQQYGAAPGQFRSSGGRDDAVAPCPDPDTCATPQAFRLWTRELS